METLELAAALRSGSGKEASKRLRREGLIPVTFYGPKRSPVTAQVNAKEFNLKVARVEGSHLIRLKSEAPDLSDCVILIKATQVHPVTSRVLHADFYEVDLSQKLEIKVPLHFVGKPVGVALNGGILQPIRREAEVSCLPMNIPEYIEVDVSGLDIHDAVHVSQLKMPEGVEASYDDDYTIVTVLPPTVEEVKVEAAEEGVVPEEGAEAPAGAAQPESGKSEG